MILYNQPCNFCIWPKQWCDRKLFRQCTVVKIQDDGHLMQSEILNCYHFRENKKDIHDFGIYLDTV